MDNLAFIAKEGSLEYLPIGEWTFTLQQHNKICIDDAKQVRQALNDLTIRNMSSLTGKLLPTKYKTDLSEIDVRYDLTFGRGGMSPNKLQFAIS